jgi:2'-5' RNA ligase
VETVRSFIAIQLPDEVKQALAELQAQLKLNESRAVKCVDPQSIHLTLQFLGDVAVNKLDEISAVMAKAVQGMSPFQLEVKGLGVFPNLKQVRVVWVDVAGDTEQLLDLQKRIEVGLVPLGFTPEKRSFTPHLTLARLRDQAAFDEKQRLGRLIAATEFNKIYQVNVDTVHLMKSQLTREGPIYSQISSVSFNKFLPKGNS